MWKRYTIDPANIYANKIFFTKEKRRTNQKLMETVTFAISIYFFLLVGLFFFSLLHPFSVYMFMLVEFFMLVPFLYLRFQCLVGFGILMPYTAGKLRKGVFSSFESNFVGKKSFETLLCGWGMGGLWQQEVLPSLHVTGMPGAGSSNSTWRSNLVWQMSTSVIMSSRPSSSVIISWYDYRWLYQSANDAIFTNYMFQLWHLFLASSWYLTMRWGTNFLVVLPKSGVWGSTSGERIVTTSNHFHLPCAQNQLTISMCPEPSAQTNLTISSCNYHQNWQSCFIR